jgi:hypothetical protein
MIRGARPTRQDDHVREVNLAEDQVREVNPIEVQMREVNITRRPASGLGDI